ncbi:unnamed protein product [Citrullus colocynthis]|uniref:Uncharacterized protein n=1 Tax=Citrullus colocynthis TaxID=252529 RepID=A0ABP0Y152_9ROSI
MVEAFLLGVGGRQKFKGTTCKFPIGRLFFKNHRRVSLTPKPTTFEILICFKSSSTNASFSKKNISKRICMNLSISYFPKKTKLICHVSFVGETQFVASKYDIL